MRLCLQKPASSFSLRDKVLISGQDEDAIASIDPLDHDDKTVSKIRLNPDELLQHKDDHN